MKLKSDRAGMGAGIAPSHTGRLGMGGTWSAAAMRFWVRAGVAEPRLHLGTSGQVPLEQQLSAYSECKTPLIHTLPCRNRLWMYC
jgi:hypothetical protein